jgi:hypothetical protein
MSANKRKHANSVSLTIKAAIEQALHQQYVVPYTGDSFVDPALSMRKNKAILLRAGLSPREARAAEWAAENAGADDATMRLLFGDTPYHFALDAETPIPLIGTSGVWFHKDQYDRMYTRADGAPGTCADPTGRFMTMFVHVAHWKDCEDRKTGAVVQLPAAGDIVRLRGNSKRYKQAHDTDAVIVRVDQYERIASAIVILDTDNPFLRSTPY